MINATKSVVMCDYPVRFDTYRGCGFKCSYCYSTTRDSSNKAITSSQQVVDFILGKRKKTTNWCDWDIPLRWGVMSDPFQPCERKYRRSLEILKVFAERPYPFIVCTKSILLYSPNVVFCAFKMGSRFKKIIEIY